MIQPLTLNKRKRRGRSHAPAPDHQEDPVPRIVARFLSLTLLALAFAGLLGSGSSTAAAPEKVLLGSGSSTAVAPEKLSSNAAVPEKTLTVCFRSDWQSWHVGSRPNYCQLHQKNTCFCHAGMVDMSSMHWTHWRKRAAQGKGKSVLGMGHTSHLHVRLYRPRRGYTSSHGRRHYHQFFSRAKLRFRGYGVSHMRLDVPHGNWIFTNG
jgi:hypothetical protein